jgi:glutamate-1-semialdehyde 2,1-aminomutase
MADQTFEETQRLHERALKTIPLASQTFSKSAMNFVEGASPLFLDRGDGAYVWDVDDNRYIDYVLGLMPIILGYRDPDVDNAIRQQLDRGISFSLATKLEPDLAEILVALYPSAEMVRFGKNGSDATSAAIRLARAYTGRDRIAICGYHGWHDWYIGTTSRHLGVPDAVRSLSSTFPYNDGDALTDLLEKDGGQFAAVILEPVGMTEPAPGYLEHLRAVTERLGVVLIFDEIQSGFRIDMGGAQTVYGVTPDLTTLGKAMGNGMPISAVVGKSEIMSLMDKIFFSGTFGGEALSLAASIATIDKLKASNAVERMNVTGGKLSAMFEKTLADQGLAQHFEVAGPNWRIGVKPRAAGEAGIIMSSLLRQELVANGVLAGGVFVVSLAHTEDVILDATEAAWKAAAEKVAEAVRSNDPASFLRGKPIRPVFQVR